MGKNNLLKIIESVPQEGNFSFAKNTTYGCGGNARIAYFPKSIRQATSIFDYLTSENIPFVTLGNGSNVLASDNGFGGAVINTKNLTGVYSTSKNTIFCRAGTRVSVLIKYCIENGFGGLEYLAGIPATLGGIVYMNGGAGGKYICNNVVKVKLYDGKMRNFSNNLCDFGYKYSTMRNISCLILGVELEICPKSSENVSKAVTAQLEKRAAQPKGKCCGCVFKNYNGTSAGSIIDAIGLKGEKIGNAVVSSEHANFILNEGTSSSDVYALIQKVKNAVYGRTGIKLEEEVIYIGDF